MTSYFVQTESKNGMPAIIWHSKEGYKFLDKKKAIALRDAEKKLSPKEKFRVVKLTEKYTPDNWI